MREIGGDRQKKRDRGEDKSKRVGLKVSERERLKEKCKKEY